MECSTARLETEHQELRHDHHQHLRPRRSRLRVAADHFRRCLDLADGPARSL